MKDCILFTLLGCLVAIAVFEGHSPAQNAVYGWQGALASSNGAGIYYNGIWFPTVRSGRKATTLSDSSQAVSFGSPMPDANYAISLSGPSSVAALLTTSSKTSNGFTVLISIPFLGNVDYIAVADQP